MFKCSDFCWYGVYFLLQREAVYQQMETEREKTEITVNMWSNAQVPHNNIIGYMVLPDST